MPEYSIQISSNAYPETDTVLTFISGVVNNTIVNDQGLDLLRGYPEALPKAVRAAIVKTERYYINQQINNNQELYGGDLKEDYYFYPDFDIKTNYPALAPYVERVSPDANISTVNSDGSGRIQSTAFAPDDSRIITSDLQSAGKYLNIGNVAANMEMVTSKLGSFIKFSVSNATSNTASLAMTINNKREVVVTGNIATSNSLLGIGSLANIRSNIPASSSAVGTKGQIAYSSGNIYICVATNTWVRTTAITSF